MRPLSLKKFLSLWQNGIEMTIKRRLFISNVLMIALPVFLSAIVGLLVYSVALYLSTERHHEADETRRGRSEARSMVWSWPRDVSVTEMLRDIENFNARFSENVRLSLYRDNTGNYQVLLTRIETRTSVLRVGFEARNFVIAASITTFIFLVVIIVFITNRFLTRFVFNIINTSIEELRYGVGQIRDGNLKYRLAADKKNEFDAVSAGFNEMAARLLDFVNSRLQDEATRKELIAGISHDLRTPLTSARAYIEGLENGLDSTAEIRMRYIQTIKNKLRDLEQMSDTLFLFSSLELDESPWILKETELTGELEKIISGFKDEYEARGLNILFLTEETKEVWVNIDSSQMRNVIINIMENSVKYKIKERGKMEIRLFTDNSTAFITMTDDGPGAPEETLDRLFDVFYRVDSSRSAAVKGSGLGLAIVAKLVHSFGGTIHAENSPSGGLSIIIQFPIAEKFKEAAT